MPDIVSTLTSVFGGGATGLLGVLFQRAFDYKAKQQDVELVKLNNLHAQELARIEADKENRLAQSTEKLAEEEAQSRLQLAEVDAQSKADEAAARSYIASVESDRATYVNPKTLARSRFARIAMTTVDAVRGLIRPVLTIYLVVIASLMFCWAKELAANSSTPIPADKVYDLVKTISDTLLYLSTTCVVWWFGVRPTAKTKSV